MENSPIFTSVGTVVAGHYTLVITPTAQKLELVNGPVRYDFQVFVVKWIKNGIQILKGKGLKRMNNGICGMQRICRNVAYYYTDISDQNNWCKSCFTNMKDDEEITLDDGKEIGKNDLQKLKNDTLPEEVWAQCDDCHN